eukprot:6525792-Prymnesium_polylepis.1
MYILGPPPIDHAVVDVARGEEQRLDELRERQAAARAREAGVHVRPVLGAAVVVAHHLILHRVRAPTVDGHKDREQRRARLL